MNSRASVAVVVAVLASQMSAATALGVRGATSPVIEPTVVISALFADGYASGDADEGLQLWNVGGGPVDLSGWLVSDGEGSAGFPPGTLIETGEHLWLARNADDFSSSFGHEPDWAWSEARGRSGRLVTVGGGPALANTGDEIVLADSNGRAVDAAVFGAGDPTPGWSGAGISAYRTSGITASNQVLYRKLDPATGAPVADTDRAVDWASDPTDPVLGRRVRYPGWDLEGHLRHASWEGPARIELAIAPDSLFEFLRSHISSATRTIEMTAYTFDNPALAEALADRARAGVRVRLLLDGSPAGGMDGNARWCAALIASAGAELYWMGSSAGIRARYLSAHAKLIVIDGRLAIVGTENPGLGAAPYDDRSDGTQGRRGAAIATDLPQAVAWLSELIGRDLDPAHADIRPYQARDPDRGAPAPDFEPAREGGGSGYSPLAATPLDFRGTLAIEAMAAPEQAPDPNEGVPRFVDRARSGDRLDVLQLSEPLYWGRGGGGTPFINPRLEAYVAAARRGAKVRVLLDGYFEERDEVNGNGDAARWLNLRAAQERLPLEARLGNPAGAGIHAKILIVRAEGAGGTDWVHIGSLNGSEASSKVNREVALQLRSSEAAAYVGAVFDHDWLHGAYHTLALPYAAVQGAAR